MINGATQIIGGVSGKNLDPVLLTRSQPERSTGFVMVAYEQGKGGEKATLELFPHLRFYDIFFFRGPKVFDCARLNPDLRYRIHCETGLKTFQEYRSVYQASVFLFEAPQEALERFRATFYYEPCLKVQMETLSDGQVLALLESSRCREGIVECNEFTGIEPSIQLEEVHSRDELARFRPVLTRGRLLVYDIEKNREILRERYGMSCDGQRILGEAEPALSSSGTAGGGGHACASRSRKKTPSRKAPGDERISSTGKADYVKVFESLARSFRKELFDCYGERSRGLIQKAEKNVCMTSPGFALDSLDESTCLCVLDLLEDITAHASVFKRQKLRQVAITLVADLYNKQYSLLEEYQAIGRLEECYYKLKG